MEAEARVAKKGLWADPQPVPPWEWRKQKIASLLEGRSFCFRESDQRSTSSFTIVIHHSGAFQWHLTL